MKASQGLAALSKNNGEGLLGVSSVHRLEDDVVDAHDDKDGDVLVKESLLSTAPGSPFPLHELSSPFGISDRCKTGLSESGCNVRRVAPPGRVNGPVVRAVVVISAFRSSVSRVTGQRGPGNCPRWSPCTVQRHIQKTPVLRALAVRHCRRGSCSPTGLLLLHQL
ncbi:hypothetical protein HPB47_020097, partial [Ixodes persulcatus]